MTKWIPPLLLIFATLGCATVGPDYFPPETGGIPSWHTELQGGLSAGQTDPRTLAAWWKTLNDPQLSALMERATAGNLDLKEARARVREARARRGLAGTELFPTLDANGSATRSRSSEETGTGKTREFFATGFDAGWELDLFGGVRRSIEAADADLQAAREDLHDVLVSLLAETALNYVETRTYQARLTSAVANLKAQEETYELTRAQYLAGLSDELAVQQARYNLENTRSQIPDLRTGLEGALNRLAVLLGEQPGKIHAALQEERPIPMTPTEIAVGVPADLLRRRPDLRRAERELAAQTARIGVATAEGYPKITLSGSIGLEALSSGDLLTAGSRTWSIGPRIVWPIFDAGAVRRNIEVQSALQEQALIRYETTLLSALEEVENSLVAYVQEQRRRESLEAAARAAQSAVDLAQEKYRAGLIDFSGVLDAQRSLLNFQDQLARSEGTVTSNLVRLYKALGGGWTPSVPEGDPSILSQGKNT
ncbi:MAG: efflux transporter outer membrane subunit [Deltaproteobacteria bacterium]|nr:efflux transporter outer membrane subunit [Deltaproteobacteria bacterium]